MGVCFHDRYRLTDSQRLNGYLNGRLEGQLEESLLAGYLTLEISEMKDAFMKIPFNEARRVLQNKPMEIIERHLNIFKDMISITTQLAALFSFTSRGSRTVLAFTALLPVLDQVIDALP